MRSRCTPLPSRVQIGRRRTSWKRPPPLYKAEEGNQITERFRTRIGELVIITETKDFFFKRRIEAPKKKERGRMKKKWIKWLYTDSRKSFVQLLISTCVLCVYLCRLVLVHIYIDRVLFLLSLSSLSALYLFFLSFTQFNCGSSSVRVVRNVGAPGRFSLSLSLYCIPKTKKKELEEEEEEDNKEKKKKTKR